jgi:predicted molibdopterin-dependent oxidoreductase YjgC
MAEAAPVRFRFEGREITAPAGASVAAALLAAGVVAFGRRPATGAPRGPFCLMGACFDCLVDIAGEGRAQACMVRARDDMVVRAAATLEPTGHPVGHESG